MEKAMKNFERMKSVYLDDKKYTETAPAGIVKQMKERGIIGERVPHDTVYIDVYGTGKWEIWWQEMGKIKTYYPWTAIVDERDTYNRV